MLRHDKLNWAVIVCVVVGICHGIAFGGILYVSSGGSGSGSGWSDALGDLSAAIGQAQIGDEIHVAGGVYYPSVGDDRTATFHLKNGVKIIGGYAGPRAYRVDKGAYEWHWRWDIGVDGRVDQKDMAALGAMWLSDYSGRRYDISCDINEVPGGKVEVLDLRELVHHWLMGQ